MYIKRIEKTMITAIIERDPYRYWPENCTPWTDEDVEVLSFDKNIDIIYTIPNRIKIPRKEIIAL